MVSCLFRQSYLHLHNQIAPRSPQTLWVGRMVQKQLMSSKTPTGDPWLFTPGPLTTEKKVKMAMVHDLGSRDQNFIRLNHRVRQRLTDIVGASDTHVAVPLQGSGTFAVEAMLRTLAPHKSQTLILANGVYGRRMAQICDYMSRPHLLHSIPEDQRIEATSVEKILSKEPGITYVAVAWCETSTGNLNDIPEISKVVYKQKKKLLIDAMSTFGGIPLNSKDIQFDALAATSNKCLEGVPGMGFCIIKRDTLEECKGKAESLSLDLYDQWKSMEKTQQWRFTPPIQTLLALYKALDLLDAEGGISKRHERYQNNFNILNLGMRRMGFKLFLSEEVQAPIIATFELPEHPHFHFETFYEKLKEKGYIIYPGKLTDRDTFRIGCIGAIDKKQVHGV